MRSCILECATQIQEGRVFAMTEESPNLKSLLQQARELYQQGNLEASADCFQKLLAARETRSEAYYGLGLIEFSQKNYVEALDFFMTATQIDSHHANAYYYIGVIYEERKDFEQARNSYLKALSSNPNHRGAKEGMSRLDNKTANNKFLTINAETSSKSQFYELLSNDNSIASQRALALIDELEFTVKPPVFSHISIVLSGVVISLGQVFLLSFFFFAFLAIVFTFIALGQEDPFSAPPPPYLALRIVATIFPLVIAARICMSIILGVKSAKNTKYEFIKGLIKITKGAFTVRTEIVELYRIKGINVVQDWFSKITGYATLELINDKSQKVVLPGIAEARRAYYLQDRLRELTVLLRSLPWIKGFIS